MSAPDAADPVEFAQRVATELRTRGRAADVVDLHDFVRPASLRLEHGRTDPYSYRHDWFDYAAVDREVLRAVREHRRWLPRLWDERTDRSARERPRRAAKDQILVVAGPMLLGRGLDFDVTVVLTMSRGALERRTRPEDHWNRVVQQGDQRPMAKKPHAMAELRALLAARERLYAEAEHVIDTSRLGIEETVDLEIDLLKLEEIVETGQLHLEMSVVGVDHSQVCGSRPVRSTGSMPDASPTMATSAGLLHGGALMALADSAGAAAAFLNLPEGASGTSTIESKTNFLGAVREGASVSATATVLHRASTTIVVETEMRTSDGKLVAKTTQTQAVLRPRG